MPRPPEQPNAYPPASRIIEDLIDLTPVLAPDLSAEQHQLLEKPVLGKDSHGEALFRRFADTMKLAERPRQINRLVLNVLPTTMTPPEIRAARIEERTPLVFHDTLAGHQLEMKHTQHHGVYYLALIDNAEPQDLAPTRVVEEESLPEASLIDRGMSKNSIVSIRLANDGRLFMTAIVQGELIESRIKDKAELGFSWICDSLMWSPSR